MSVRNLAQFAIRHRWWVIAGWLVFIVGTQAIAGSLGGANYKDEFKLPGTETQTVSTLLRDSGLDSQNGIDGNMVLHVNNGDLATPPAGVVPALEGLCKPGSKVLEIATPSPADRSKRSEDRACQYHLRGRRVVRPAGHQSRVRHAAPAQDQRPRG
jgi:hypothetical protein